MADAKSSTPVPRVMFRPGVLFAELEPRVRRGEDISAVARRDLDRYYQLIGAVLATVVMSREQALVCCEVTRGRDDIVAAIVDDARDHGTSPAPGQGPLVDVAVNWTPVQRMAIVDAVERFWLLCDACEDIADALVEAGLIRPDQPDPAPRLAGDAGNPA
jgi:hypothetical protein